MRITTNSCHDTSTIPATNDATNVATDIVRTQLDSIYAIIPLYLIIYDDRRRANRMQG